MFIEEAPPNVVPEEDPIPEQVVSTQEDPLPTRASNVPKFARRDEQDRKRAFKPHADSTKESREASLEQRQKQKRSEKLKKKRFQELTVVTTVPTEGKTEDPPSPPPPPPIDSPAVSTSTADLVDGFEEAMRETVSHGKAVLEELKKGFDMAED